VEVLSPDDRAGEALAKVQQWLAAGCQSVWIVDPSRRTAAIHTAQGPTRTLHGTEEVTEPELLPGFCVAAAEIFAT
jgi:Uma2 family endonuclease